MFAQASGVQISPIFELAEYNGFDALPNWIDPFIGTPEERMAKLNTPGVRDRMKQDAFKGRLDRDKVTRASLIIGIFKGLRLLFNGPLTTEWPTLANKGAPYNGRRPVDMMIAGGIPAMAAVRQHIDALRGGL